MKFLRRQIGIIQKQEWLVMQNRPVLLD